jgi:alkanesulfonate monooxygenase SsuD/methylene tetrahydromethanopterin reductase-like flavin-dependent oxidoreductase (luciferase family)
MEGERKEGRMTDGWGWGWEWIGWCKAVLSEGCQYEQEPQQLVALPQQGNALVVCCCTGSTRTEQLAGSLAVVVFLVFLFTH